MVACDIAKPLLIKNKKTTIILFWISIAYEISFPRAQNRSKLMLPAGLYKQLVDNS
jgi:hypothetical protein